MKPPIIINANGDVYFYDTLEQAEQSIEPPDVRNGIYDIYDSKGLVLIPKVVDDPVYDVVKILPSDENKQTELIETLIDFFSTVGHDSLILKTMNLNELINLGLTKFS
jgi:hypothetical protein